MTLVAEFCVRGPPVPKARARSDPRSGRMYTPAKSVAYERRVAAAAFAASRWERVDGELRRRVDRWPEPKGCKRAAPRRRRTRTPKCGCNWCSAEFRIALAIYLPDRRTRDADNIEKAILDGMKGILYRDDFQAIVERKSRALSRTNPRVEVLVRMVPPAQSSLHLEEPTVELVQCSGCEGRGGFEVGLPSGRRRRVVCGDCAGTGRAQA